MINTQQRWIYTHYSSLAHAEVPSCRSRLSKSVRRSFSHTVVGARMALCLAPPVTRLRAGERVGGSKQSVRRGAGANTSSPRRRLSCWAVDKSLACP